MYAVEVHAIAGYTRHSDHDSYRCAVDQADMVQGRVIIAETGLTDLEAWRHAQRHQGCELSFGEWQQQEDDERNQYELGAQGIGTA